MDSFSKHADAINSPITYWGGKKLMARHIVPLIPKHTTYVEPFFGGGAIFFQKAPSEVEVINDLNRFVVNFFHQIKCDFEGLQAAIQSTPHSRALYRDALVMYQNPHLFSGIQKAWAFWILCNEGYAGKIGTWGYGTTDGKREASLQNKRDLFDSRLVQRLERTQIECADALRIIGLRDRPTTFFYIDPPYYNSNMGHYGGYTEKDFRELLELLSKIQGKFVLSSYPSEVLAEFTQRHDWKTVEFNLTCHASPKQKKKTEVLTMNY
jgi:DNA adenine methylase